MQTVGRPEDIGLSGQGIDRLYGYMQQLVDTDRVATAAIGIARYGRMLAPAAFGRMQPDVGAPVQPDTIFLTASVTKPVTCAAVCHMIQQGRFDLDTPVAALIPEFGQNGKGRVAVRHLLTHTSGLPDMIPENVEYRKRFAPLEDFLKRIYELKIDFDPGMDIRYQSTGIAVLGEIVRRISGLPLPQYLQLVFFKSFGMKDTSLGSDGIDTERVAHVRLSPEQDAETWTWNKPYWRRFGAPWGGMFSTVRDMNVFLQAFLAGGIFEGVRVLEPATVADMIQNHTALMPGIPQTSKAREARGLGWRINEPRNTSGVETPPSERAFGHNGATGTLVWADPDIGVSCVLFTGQPDMCDSVEIRRCTDLVIAALTH
ncbi:MAG: beta-lactamase family protein [candidate division Zixibacteria bacterium]|nr:beta-lactamase family protein [candidate division Zixibacteria bacterium]